MGISNTARSKASHVQQSPDGPGPFLTNYAFDMRYSLPERIAIERLALEKDANGEFTDNAIAAQVSLTRANKAGYTNPKRSETRVGVMAFVQAGILTNERALEILDAPIQPKEEYRG